MADFDRVERPHFSGHGTQLLIADSASIDSADLSDLPTPTLALFEQWTELRAALPPSLAWATDPLAAREAILECTCFDDRVYWTVRLPVHGALEALGRPCLGADGVASATDGLPTPLDWLAQLGRVDVLAESSGTSSWGVSLRERRGAEMLPWMFSPFDAGEDLIVLPDGSDDWLELYEVDGDSVYADLESGCVKWLGGEWTGDPITTFDLDWRPALHFIFWRLLDGGFVRPTDLEMLAAAR